MAAFGMMEKMVGTDFEKGLSKLKTICEPAVRSAPGNPAGS